LENSYVDVVPLGFWQGEGVSLANVDGVLLCQASAPLGLLLPSVSVRRDKGGVKMWCGVTDGTAKDHEAEGGGCQEVRGACFVRSERVFRPENNGGRESRWESPVARRLDLPVGLSTSDTGVLVKRKAFKTK
jgi:hypothetical protein